MKMVLREALRIGRAAAFTVGLAVMLALMLGIASTALGANGDNFILGQNNVATAITRLAGAVGVDGPMLLVDNNNAGPRATALELRVEPGKAPMKVNSAERVNSLNADRLDGQDSTAFLATDGKAADSDTVDGHHAVCPFNPPGGTLVIRGFCFDVSPRGPAESVFTASDTCRAAGGFLPTTLLLRSTRDVLDLGSSAADSRYADAIHADDGSLKTMAVQDSGGVAQIGTHDDRRFHCAYQLVR
jgi:hypothetical protein